jgi:hypothetical protein
VMINGKNYTEKWASCNFPRCKTKYRCESTKGTTGFWTHLRTTHSVVKGQQQLAVGMDHGKDINIVEPYKYDQEVNSRKFYLAIIMHGYPFNIVEHEYLIDFLKSLRPSFPITDDKEFQKYLCDTYSSELDCSNDLDKYMDAQIFKHSGQFDILAWWKNQGKEYLILSQMARDGLAIQVSTVASESAFSASGRVVDPYRSRLDPEMVQALVCTKDWVAAARRGDKFFSFSLFLIECC